MTKILLVEDDKSLREIYGVRLLAEGYDIVSAGDGEEALATAIKEKPDLIVSDVMMPKISGFDMLDILRSTPETKDIRVIMMTALSSDDQRDRGEKLGADRYLVKSQVGIEDVVRTVHEVLGDAPIAAPQFSSMQSQQQPQPQPTPAPQVQEPSQPEPEQLPQPTAPFSSPRPATLGERIIHPIESAASQSNNANEVSLADRISAELEQANAQAQQSPQAQPEPIQQAPQQQVQQQQPQVQQVPVQQQDYQMPQTQQFEQPQAQQPVAQPQETTPETQPIQLSQPEMQMPQQQTQPQMQMQQAPEPTQPQQSPTESPQPLQIDPNDVNHGRTFNVPPRQ